MNKDQIVSAVRKSARIHTPEHARGPCGPPRGCLETVDRKASDLAVQLPPELAAELLPGERLQRFDSQDFYRRVASEEDRGCSEQEARQHAGGCRPSRGGWRPRICVFGPAAG
jgi:uncharacterized protein (DUF2267 family)